MIPDELRGPIGSLALVTAILVSTFIAGALFLAGGWIGYSLGSVALVPGVFCLWVVFAMAREDLERSKRRKR